MRRRSRLTKLSALVAAISLSCFHLAQAGALPDKSDVATLKPVSPWKLDFAENACRLSREFGSEGRRNLLSLEQISPSSVVTMTAAGPDFQGMGKYGLVTIEVRPDHGTTAVSPRWLKLTTYGEGLVLTGLSFDPEFFAKQYLGDVLGISDSMAIDLKDADSVKRLGVRLAGRSVVFETGAMIEPFRALNACSMDLLGQWGLSAKEHSGHRPAELQNETFQLSSIQSKYARGPGRKRHEALLKVRAIIEPDGSISDCFFEYAISTGGETFDACAEIRKMKFRPATTASGKPMRSFYAASIPLSWVDPLAL